MSKSLPSLIIPPQYSKLLKEVRQEIKDSKERMKQFAAQEVIASHWSVGRRIEQYLKDNNQHKDGYVSLYRLLAKDLDVTTRLLGETVRFYRAFPRLKVNKNLSWTHYRLLLSVDDKQKRLALENKIVREKITVDGFRKLLRVQKQSKEPKLIKRGKLAVVRGQVYAYRLISVDDIHINDDQLLIDVGFGIRMHRPKSARNKYNSGAMVKSFYENGQYELLYQRGVRDQLYTYGARVKRVVDGDTLLVNIDCGFGIWIEERLRLRGVNAPELRSIDGDRAKKFVEDRLKKVEFIIIKTQKSKDIDKYGRYVVDVFYGSKGQGLDEVAQKGQYLNQELLDEGLAEIYS